MAMWSISFSEPSAAGTRRLLSTVQRGPSRASSWDVQNSPRAPTRLGIDPSLISKFHTIHAARPEKTIPIPSPPTNHRVLPMMASATTTTTTIADTAATTIRKVRFLLTRRRVIVHAKVINPRPGLPTTTAL